MTNPRRFDPVWSPISAAYHEARVLSAQASAAWTCGDGQQASERAFAAIRAAESARASVGGTESPVWAWIWDLRALACRTLAAPPGEAGAHAQAAETWIVEHPCPRLSNCAQRAAAKKARAEAADAIQRARTRVMRADTAGPAEPVADPVRDAAVLAATQADQVARAAAVAAAQAWAVVRALGGS